MNRGNVVVKRNLNLSLKEKMSHWSPQGQLAHLTRRTAKSTPSGETLPGLTRQGEASPDKIHFRISFMYFRMAWVTLAQLSFMRGWALPSPRELPFAMAFPQDALGGLWKGDQLDRMCAWE